MAHQRILVAQSVPTYPCRAAANRTHGHVVVQSSDMATCCVTCLTAEALDPSATSDEMSSALAAVSDLFCRFPRVAAAVTEHDSVQLFSSWLCDVMLKVATVAAQQSSALVCTIRGLIASLPLPVSAHGLSLVCERAATEIELEFAFAMLADLWLDSAPFRDHLTAEHLHTMRQAALTCMLACESLCLDRSSVGCELTDTSIYLCFLFHDAGVDILQPMAADPDRMWLWACHLIDLAVHFQRKPRGITINAMGLVLSLCERGLSFDPSARRHQPLGAAPDGVRGAFLTTYASRLVTSALPLLLSDRNDVVLAATSLLTALRDSLQHSEEATSLLSEMSDYVCEALRSCGEDSRLPLLQLAMRCCAGPSLKGGGAVAVTSSQFSSVVYGHLLELGHKDPAFFEHVLQNDEFFCGIVRSADMNHIVSRSTLITRVLSFPSAIRVLHALATHSGRALLTTENLWLISTAFSWCMESDGGGCGQALVTWSPDTTVRVLDTLTWLAGQEKTCLRWCTALLSAWHARKEELRFHRDPALAWRLLRLLRQAVVADGKDEQTWMESVELTPVDVMNVALTHMSTAAVDGDNDNEDMCRHDVDQVFARITGDGILSSEFCSTLVSSGGPSRPRCVGTLVQRMIDTGHTERAIRVAHGIVVAQRRHAEVRARASVTGIRALGVDILFAMCSNWELLLVQRTDRHQPHFFPTGRTPLEPVVSSLMLLDIVHSEGAWPRLCGNDKSEHAPPSSASLPPVAPTFTSDDDVAVSLEASDLLWLSRRLMFLGDLASCVAWLQTTLRQCSATTMTTLHFVTGGVVDVAILASLFTHSEAPRALPNVLLQCCPGRNSSTVVRRILKRLRFDVAVREDDDSHMASRCDFGVDVHTLGDRVLEFASNYCCRWTLREGETDDDGEHVVTSISVPNLLLRYSQNELLASYQRIERLSLLLLRCLCHEPIPLSQPLQNDRGTSTCRDPCGYDLLFFRWCVHAVRALIPHFTATDVWEARGSPTLRLVDCLCERLHGAEIASKFLSEVLLRRHENGVVTDWKCVDLPAVALTVCSVLHNDDGAAALVGSLTVDSLLYHFVVDARGAVSSFSARAVLCAILKRWNTLVSLHKEAEVAADAGNGLSCSGGVSGPSWALHLLRFAVETACCMPTPTIATRSSEDSEHDDVLAAAAIATVTKVLGLFPALLADYSVFALAFWLRNRTAMRGKSEAPFPIVIHFALDAALCAFIYFLETMRGVTSALWLQSEVGRSVVVSLLKYRHERAPNVIKPPLIPHFAPVDRERTLFLDVRHVLELIHEATDKSPVH